jgi:bifunctional non-homologous end joining protein LigD
MGPNRMRSKKPKALDPGEAAVSEMPRDVEPMLCTQLPKPFDRADWIFEIKWDGFRAIAEIDRTGVRLHSRKRKSLNGYFPELLESLAKLGHEAVLDGEVVVLD